MTTGPLLIVEDSDEDFYAMTRALGKDLPCEIVRCCTGSEALDYLYRRANYTEAVRPALVLLDLNLPGTDGRVTLEVLKKDPELETLPVVVVSTSENPADVVRCEAIGCNGYVVKTIIYEQFAERLREVRDRWLPMDGNV